MYHRLKATCSILAICALSPLSTVQAQMVPPTVSPGNIERALQAEPKLLSTGEILIPTPRIDALSGSSAGLKFTLSSVEIDGAKVMSAADLRPFYQALVGLQVSLGQVFAVANQITAEYAARGYSLSIAYVPAQKIGQDGAVRIVVVEGGVGSVAVQNVRSGTEKRITATLEPLLGQTPLKTAELESRLLHLRDIPGLTIASTIDQSRTSLGQTHLIVTGSEDRFEGTLGLTNRASKALGPWRLNGGLTFNMPELNASSLTVSGVWAPKDDELKLFSASGSTALGHLGTRLFGAVTVNDAAPGTRDLRLLEFLSSGDSYSIGISHPLIRARQQNLIAAVNLDVRNLEGSLLGEQVNHEKLRTLRASLSYDRISSKGAQSYGKIEVSKGVNILKATAAQDPKLSRLNANPFGTYITADLQHMQYLHNSSLMMTAKITGQFSFDDLVSSNQCGFGGGRILKGYDSFEITGDHCVGGALELAYNFGSVNQVRHITGYGFIDYGKTWVKDPALGSAKSQQRTSAGGGLRFQLRESFSLFVEMALPLSEKVRLQGTKNARLFAGITSRF